MNSSITNIQNSTAVAQGQATAKAQAAGAAGATKGELGKDDFLRLLMVQLKQQDPMAPKDSTEFIGQLTQFANLEGVTNLGKKMDDLVTISGASNSATAVSLLGKEVRVGGNKIKGDGRVFYELGEAADQLRLEVRDAQGVVVKSMDRIPNAKGSNEVVIDGLTPGDYTFNIIAKDVKGKDIETRLSVSDKVEGLSFSGTVPILMMSSGINIKASEVVEIRMPVVTPTGGAG